VFSEIEKYLNIQTFPKWMCLIKNCNVVVIKLT